jgi:hypothetical protein
MDVMKLRQALAMLHAFTASLPRGDIEEKYVVLYHKTLDDIRAQTNQDLSYFHIPEDELQKKLTMTYDNEDTGQRESLYSDEYYCARERFLMSLRGAISFINASTQDRGATTLPLIDPPK